MLSIVTLSGDHDVSTLDICVINLQFIQSSEKRTFLLHSPFSQQSVESNYLHTYIQINLVYFMIDQTAVNLSVNHRITVQLGSITATATTRIFGIVFDDQLSFTSTLQQKPGHLYRLYVLSHHL